MLSSCVTDIKNNLNDFNTNSKLVDLIIKDWRMWIKFARKHRLSIMLYYSKIYNNRLQKSTLEFLRIINENLLYLCYIISGDKTNSLFSYIVNKLNFDFEENNTFKIGDKEYKIIDPYHNYFYPIFDLFYKFIEYDNSINYHIELALEELPIFYIKYCEYSYKKKKETTKLNQDYYCLLSCNKFILAVFTPTKAINYLIVKKYLTFENLQIKKQSLPLSLLTSNEGNKRRKITKR